MSDSNAQQHAPPPSVGGDAQTPRPVSKVPTGLGAEPLNIVILGASYAGLAVAHRFLDDTINQLRISKAAPNYRLIIINPSTHFYWNIGAPRALVKPDLIPQDDLFICIESLGLHRHRAHNVSFIRGEAVALDSSARTVAIELIGSTAQKRASLINKRGSRLSGVPIPKTQTIPYHALIIATGTSTHSDLLGLHGPHLNTMGALNAVHAKLAAARSIIICGGGSSGVETAGQLATYLNHDSRWPFKKRVKHLKKITLITGGTMNATHSSQPISKRQSSQPTSDHLRDFNTDIGTTAEKMLQTLGVEIIHNVRVIAAKQDFDLTGATKVELNNDTSIIADVYIPCTGVEPNTAYIPASLKDAKGYILTNRSTHRCDAMDAGPRVYAIGDCAAYSRNCIQDVYAAVPTLMRNLVNDLLAHEYRLASPYGGDQDKIDELQDLSFEQKDREMVLCPISRFGGVGIWKGKAVPKFLVHLLKGRDYRLGKGKGVVEYGRDPYA